jgi:hypothetical protein
VTVTRLTIAVLALVYLALWVLEFAGAKSLLGPLLIPVVLAVLVAGGVALDRIIGIKPRKQKFVDKDDQEQP